MSSSYFFVGFALAALLALLVRYGYGWAMAARGWLYDQGVFASETFGIPVIALGNLRVGGTGKSPHAAYVVGALLAAGYRVALLSRGYGRQTRGFRVVTPAVPPAPRLGARAGRHDTVRSNPA